MRLSNSEVLRHTSRYLELIAGEPALGIPQATLQEMLNRLEDTFKEIVTGLD